MIKRKYFTDFWSPNDKHDVSSGWLEIEKEHVYLHTNNKDLAGEIIHGSKYLSDSDEPVPYALLYL